MKHVLAFLLCCLCVPFIVEAQTQIVEKLDGVWIPVKQELEGSELPPEGFAKHKLVIKDTTYSYTAESTESGVLKFNGNKLDIYGKVGVNTGRHFATIFKFENGLLTICYNLKGDSYPESFETKGKNAFFKTEFKRAN